MNNRHAHQTLAPCALLLLLCHGIYAGGLEACKEEKMNSLNKRLFALIRSTPEDNNQDSIEQLIDLGADPDLADLAPPNPQSFATPLLAAIYHSKPELAISLIRKEANPNKGGSKYGGWYPLSMAAHRNMRNVIDHLLLKGASTEFEAKHPHPLLYALAFPDITRHLVDSGVTLPEVFTAANGESQSLTAWLVSQKNVLTMKRLIDLKKYICERSARLQAQNQAAARPEITFAKGNAYVKALALMDLFDQPEINWDQIHQSLEEGVALNVVELTGKGRTILGQALHRGQWLFARELIERGADPNVKGGNGWTQLCWAAYHDKQTAAEVLLNFGAVANTGSEPHPLTIAMEQAHWEMADLLIARGVSIPQTAPQFMQTAFKNGDTKALEFCMKHGIA